ncbi:hypothetical protein A3A52_01080 [Candidatus Woesebacteria bacterium RIFCSPLOWO2_01_FULL_39_14]|uniref:Glycerate dehydrogenase n=1 Tax=Candidatus Woesebacteria bacterium RIFCSPLOWO2_01_FULL_39_14 TaxID=1802518 RepID=A0A1F8BBJ6_9BACT|nr:MAG: Phosphoglycerate dehydrogenase [Microgenomates group bacterium GW2011_GWC1_38_12]OGM61412.1 MAG: hypothetical protein A3A52_01080 [Candidatus Woesebacteria bacterium RIFCSPLOWO2_01_FULL_39_14]
MKIVIPEKIDVIPQKFLDELKKLGQVKIYDNFPIGGKEILERIKDAEILIVKWIYLPENFLDICKNLKYIVSLTSGYGHFPLKEARSKKIVIVNSPIHNSHAVAEHTITLMFAVARGIFYAQENVKKGNWKDSPYDFLGVELAGKVLAQVGYGNIGKRVVELARGVGMKVAVADSKTTDKKLDEMISKADFISLNVPLTERTEKLIDERRINLMKKGAYFINTARGDIVDQNALYKALADRKIAGAGLDVFMDTPPVGKAPREVIKLASLKNVIVTPHLAFNTKEAGERMGREMLDNVKAIIKGKPINVVN